MKLVTFPSIASFAMLLVKSWSIDYQNYQDSQDYVMDYNEDYDPVASKSYNFYNDMPNSFGRFQYGTPNGGWYQQPVNRFQPGNFYDYGYGNFYGNPNPSWQMYNRYNGGFGAWNQGGRTGDFHGTSSNYPNTKPIYSDPNNPPPFKNIKEPVNAYFPCKKPWTKEKVPVCCASEYFHDRPFCIHWRKTGRYLRRRRPHHQSHHHGSSYTPVHLGALVG